MEQMHEGEGYLFSLFIFILKVQTNAKFQRLKTVEENPSEITMKEGMSVAS